MRKIMLLILFLSTISGTMYSQKLDKNSLCKKWYLHHYEYLWKDYPLEEKEKNDYMIFNSDMTFTSVDEGIECSGKWSFDPKEKSILMKDSEKEEIKLLVKKINDDELIFKVDHKELKAITIHYSTSKNSK